MKSIDTTAADTSKHQAAPQLLDAVKRLIPSLAPERYKGQAGKVAVIGGCREYTGAPFFAAYSALKIGADLSHVFCTSGASTVIKGYSPELIVHPYLQDSEDLPAGIESSTISQQEELKTRAIEAVCRWLDRFDVLVVGPGLGRDPLVLSTVEAIIKEALRKQIALVIDADGLFLVTQNPELVRGQKKVVLTPNAAEFRRLSSKLEIQNIQTQNDESDRAHITKSIAQALQGPVLVSKGSEDILSDGQVVVHCSEQGSLRRAGGQGDVMAGAIAAFVAWSQKTTNDTGSDSAIDGAAEKAKLSPLVLAAYGGCLATRLAARRAFTKQGRAMGATDVLQELGGVVDALVV